MIEPSDCNQVNVNREEEREEGIVHIITSPSLEIKDQRGQDERGTVSLPFHAPPLELVDVTSSSPIPPSEIKDQMG